MSTVRTSGKIGQTDGANFIERVRVPPNIEEVVAAHVAAGEWKLDAGINVPIRRDIARGMSRAAGYLFQEIRVSVCRQSTELLGVSD
jgi:hypothetical protein